MFFVGAFSGNLLYLVLAISSLAGCSAMVFRSSESQLKTIKTIGSGAALVLHDNQLPSGRCACFYNKTIDQSDHGLLAGVSVMPPVNPFFEALYFPALHKDISRFSGSPLFSRPPPFSLI